MGRIRQPIMTVLTKEFVQPEGYPDTTTVNQRVGQAVARLQVRGAQLPMNPLVTEWRLEALIRVLYAKGIIDQQEIDDITYFTAYLQMQTIERLVDEKPQTTLVVPSVSPKPLS
jgi:hypothetical protein